MHNWYVLRDNVLRLKVVLWATLNYDEIIMEDINPRVLIRFDNFMVGKVFLCYNKPT